MTVSGPTTNALVRSSALVHDLVSNRHAWRDPLNLRLVDDDGAVDDDVGNAGRRKGVLADLRSGVLGDGLWMGGD